MVVAAEAVPLDRGDDGLAGEAEQPVVGIAIVDGFPQAPLSCMKTNFATVVRGVMATASLPKFTRAAVRNPLYPGSTTLVLMRSRPRFERLFV